MNWTVFLVADECFDNEGINGWYFAISMRTHGIFFVMCYLISFIPFYMRLSYSCWDRLGNDAYVDVSIFSSSGATCDESFVKMASFPFILPNSDAAKDEKSVKILTRPFQYLLASLLSVTCCSWADVGHFWSTWAHGGMRAWNSLCSACVARRSVNITAQKTMLDMKNA